MLSLAIYKVHEMEETLFKILKFWLKMHGCREMTDLNGLKLFDPPKLAAKKDKNGNLILFKT